MDNLDGHCRPTTGDYKPSLDRQVEPGWQSCNALSIWQLQWRTATLTANLPISTWHLDITDQQISTKLHRKETVTRARIPQLQVQTRTQHKNPHRSNQTNRSTTKRSWRHHGRWGDMRQNPNHATTQPTLLSLCIWKHPHHWTDAAESHHQACKRRGKTKPTHRRTTKPGRQGLPGWTTQTTVRAKHIKGKSHIERKQQIQPLSSDEPSPLWRTEQQTTKPVSQLWTMRPLPHLRTRRERLFSQTKRCTTMRLLQNIWSRRKRLLQQAKTPD